ncbi:DNA starvation/stationary phase protection protein Dps [Aurantimonas coralicida]|uniref:DNA starvation/stationary phase protection protein Dps n=1 Tax=Aurantimonas coralicida TaxID=182270 RepID=UPI001E634D1E|nr:DNA starvation/stationary phase protection protein Dps [Aurantimonas coralicida]MCD1642850.1 DNA starvation/stationary phase protection protein Dps [Aurantimonas coralicida]|eukprot:TRINITY_DN32610_c0_g1_i1.p2 TRINITY_DN32610_c0_g1~~TRINITY_DN32610_c0_g1_i1.p2  ORF type:complete len:167 (-),score=54.02 TRINITY_DN32610_c0_g1_i1:30-530(-)
MAKTTKTKMHKTMNPISENIRGSMVELLQTHLATAVDITYQTKQAHWNVKGMNFIAVHELFDDLHEETEEYVDTIAERLTAIGGQAHGTVQAASENSLLDPYPLDLVKSEDHLKRLTESYAKWSAAIAEGIEEASEAGDPLTEDLLTAIGRGLDKGIYFMESHFQA